MNPKPPSRSLVPLAALCATLLLYAFPARAQVDWVTTQNAATANTGNVQLASAKLRVQVFPAWLEVEEELELLATGSVNPQNNANTLQIRGTFTLPAGAVITGALLWEGNRLLQARLLDKIKADSVYDGLADRDSAPAPRPIDPLLLEYAGANKYTVKVYPVPLGSSRRLRLRYQLPPRLGVEGFEMRLQAALIPQFTSLSTVSATLESRTGTSTVRFSEGGSKRELTLPRTLFLERQWLAGSASATAAARILANDSARQVQVRTSFGAGAFKGHYLNLYGAVDDATLAALGRIEVVVFWKWHNPLYWKNSPGYVAEAKAQASSLILLYGALGVPGTRVGLLHDDAHRPQKAFPVAAQGTPTHAAGLAYLLPLSQGNTIQNFVDSLAARGGGGTPPPVADSRSRFLANMRIVKTLYSPEEGVTRHLILMSTGPEYATSDIAANAAFDSVFADRPVSVGMHRNQPFTQAGLDFDALRQARPLQGPSTTVSGTSVPAFPAVTLYATVRNAAKAYDFSLACTGGLSVTCPALEFHGKSETPWSDTVSWEAFEAGGRLLGRSKTRPRLVSAASDTSTALLWAGSSAPFSETHESPLGPVYGFVDASASLLAMARDSLSGTAYADTGVPRGGPVVVPNPPTVPGANPNIAVRGAAFAAQGWRLERAGANLLSLRIPGLAAGARVEVELIGLDGKRVGSWRLAAEAGAIRWSVAGIRPGAYLLRVRGPNLHGERLLTL